MSFSFGIIAPPPPLVREGIIGDWHPSIFTPPHLRKDTRHPRYRRLYNFEDYLNFQDRHEGVDNWATRQSFNPPKWRVASVAAQKIQNLARARSAQNRVRAIKDRRFLRRQLLRDLPSAELRRYISEYI